MAQFTSEFASLRKPLCGCESRVRESSVAFQLVAY